MLILRRRINQSIMIQNGRDKPIEIMVTSIKDGGVGLGIDAPKSVIVDRKEVFIERLRAAGRKLLRQTNVRI